ncbi:glycosyl transferase [Sulfitobacter sp. D35]|uniref:glycosyl transferase n=1 Tax=Sulfitobacter sp. D35 TaxID=3083252 RepID=UPI00296F8BD6|nr:glycosyl transferase [Sulfitobacter sp. D35]MDW4498373.1 glycosyl transferase [Sulfitobacter sp. D35]
MRARSDRPWRRKLVKHGFQVLGGKARAHGQDVWPFLKLTKPRGDVPGRIVWKGEEAGKLLPWAAAREFLAGRPVLICGSGPSVRQADVTRWADGPAILLNGALSLAPRFGTVRIGAIEDERFVWRHVDMIGDEAERIELWLLSPSVIRALLSFDAGWAEGRRIFLIDDIVKPLNGTRRALQDPEIAACFEGQERPMVSLHPETGVVPAGTVAFSAAQIALAADPRSIGFLGVDLTSANAPRFYETAEARAKSGIVGALARILEHFEAFAEVAAARNVSLRCHSASSALLDLGIPEDRELAA